MHVENPLIVSVRLGDSSVSAMVACTRDNPSLCSLSLSCGAEIQPEVALRMALPVLKNSSHLFVTYDVFPGDPPPQDELLRFVGQVRVLTGPGCSLQEAFILLDRFKGRTGRSSVLLVPLHGLGLAANDGTQEILKEQVAELRSFALRGVRRGHYVNLLLSGQRTLGIPHKVYWSAAAEAARLKNDYPEFIMVDAPVAGPVFPILAGQCPAGRISAHIDGMVLRPCPFVQEPSVIMRDAGGFHQAWLLLREALWAERYGDQAGSYLSCPDASRCGGGCPGHRRKSRCDDFCRRLSDQCERGAGG